MKRKPFPPPQWFPIAKTFTLRCCQCGMKHRWKLRVKKDRTVEAMVLEP